MSSTMVHGKKVATGRASCGPAVKARDPTEEGEPVAAGDTVDEGQPTLIQSGADALLTSVAPSHSHRID